jgi:CDP-diacylglycerol---serine O-phosphatidyltransferase
VIGALAGFLTTEPWATLLAVGALYVVSIPLSIRSYRKLREAAEELRAGLRADVPQESPGRAAGE